MGACGLTVTGAGTYDTVENQIAQFTQKGDIAYSTAIDALNTISEGFNSKVVEAGLNLESTPAKGAAPVPEYVRPEPEPEAPDIEWEAPEPPTAPPEYTADFGSYFSGITKPTFTESKPTLQFASPPSRSLPTAPNEPDPLTVPTYPSAPTLTMPTIGPSTAINLPTLNDPDIAGIQATIAALRGSLPESPTLPTDINFIDVVNQLFGTASGQISDVVSGLLPRLNTMLGGGTGLPSDVAVGLRNRAIYVEDRLAAQAEQTAIADWLSRGFTLPGGALEAKLKEVQQKSSDKITELNLSFWLEEAKLEVENLRFAVQQGVAYEAMRKDALTKLYGVCGDLAAKSADVQIKLLEAAVNIYQAQVQAWQVQFSTIRDEIQLELGKIEIFKAELEGQKLISELNQQDIDLYKVKVDALNTRANLYKTEVDAANSILQGELGKLQYAAERVKIYTAEVGAWETEWKAYGEAIRAEQGKVDIYKAVVDGFTAEVNAYAKDIDAAKTQASLQLESLQFGLQSWTAQLEKYKADIQGESVRINALSDVYRNQMSGYALKHESEKTYITSELQKLDYFLNVDRFNTDTTLKEAQLEQDKVLQLVKIAQDSLDAVARTSAQLAGSAMSAMNVGASISAGSSTSQSSSCSETYTYEG
jgi:hypothetical protein